MGDVGKKDGAEVGPFDGVRVGLTDGEVGARVVGFIDGMAEGTPVGLVLYAQQRFSVGDGQLLVG